jgi:hypothetical protein
VLIGGSATIVGHEVKTVPQMGWAGAVSCSTFKRTLQLENTSLIALVLRQALFVMVPPENHSGSYLESSGLNSSAHLGQNTKFT